MSQLQGVAVNSNLPNTEILQINGLGRDPKLDTLIVYVENIGSEASDIISEHVFEVNDINIPLTEESIDKKILDPGQIGTINIPFKISPNIPIVVKIIGDGVIFAESKIDSDLLLSCYVLSVNIQGNVSNKVTKIPDQLSYPSGSSVSLLAEPGADWSFSDWSGDVVGLNNPLTVVIDSNKNIYANFAEKIAPPIDVDPPDDIEETVKVTFSLKGIDSSSIGTILTIEGTSKSYSNFPVNLNIVKGSFLNYKFSESIVSSISGERFALKSIIGL
ncbi:MAG: InlB B-repeat-containing protein [Candidatus Heimdallarchaeaceae archaeon]